MPVATSSARSPGPSARQVGRALAPAVVQPRRHDRVHEVVDAGDAVEHRAHLPLLEGARTGVGRAHGARAADSPPLGPPPFAAARGSRPSPASSPPAGRRTTASARSGSRASAGSRLRQLVADLGQVRARPVVAVLADLVAGEAARLRHDELAGLVLRGDLHVDLVRRAGRRAEVGQVAHRDDREDAGDRRDRPPLGPPLRPAVDERQQDQQDHADRRHADRRERRQDRRLDHAQQLEEEEEVPLGPRHVGRRRRVGLRAQLGAETERHHDDRQQHDARHHRVLGHRVGEERLPLRLQQRVLAEVGLLLALVHARPRSSASSSSPSSAFSHGGAVVPSRVTRYRCAPISAAIAPGTSSMWIA